MAEVLLKLNQSAPVTDIDADPEQYVWDDEIDAEQDDDYYTEYGAIPGGTPPGAGGGTIVVGC